MAREFVAEIGLNHDGSFDLAYELIRQAKLAGATAAKFQLGWRNDPAEINHIDLERARTLRAWCEYHELELLASIFTDDALELARAIELPAYKIASRTVVDRPDLCERILADGKPTYVSLGMWEGSTWPFGRPSEQLRYLFCIAKYPARPADVAALPERFGADGWYGYSDHTQGIAACLLALARGAHLIEKHFTLDKTSQVIRDHVLSATPDEFRALCEHGGELGRLVDAVAAG
jgi:sialic acid synthase SpsE